MAFNFLAFALFYNRRTSSFPVCPYIFVYIPYTRIFEYKVTLCDDEDGLMSN